MADNSVAMKANMKIIKPMEGIGKRWFSVNCGPNLTDVPSLPKGANVFKSTLHSFGPCLRRSRRIERLQRLRRNEVNRGQFHGSDQELIIVRSENDGRALIGDVNSVLPEGLPARHVQKCRRLVHEDPRRLLQHGACEHDPLRLSVAEGIHALLRPSRFAEHRKNFCCTCR